MNNAHLISSSGPKDKTHSRVNEEKNIQRNMLLKRKIMQIIKHIQKWKLLLRVHKQHNAKKML